MTTVWRGVTLDDRTAAMMEEVARLSGDVYVRPTQGSYSGGVSASAGTHDGGGAIDIAGQDAGMTQAHRETICNAGRQVGFAMWIRSPDQSDWPWHIHGEAVQADGKHDQGCLSSGAHGQVIDYFEGRNGLASGAPDDGPRHWVGVTWETYQAAKPPPILIEEDMPKPKVFTALGGDMGSGADDFPMLMTPDGRFTGLSNQTELDVANRYVRFATDDDDGALMQIEVSAIQTLIGRAT